MERRVSRRALLGVGAGVGAGIALPGCAPGDGSAGDAGPGGPAGRPAHIPFDGPTPDLVGDGSTGVPNGFLRYPDPPPSTGRVPLNLSAPVEFLVQQAIPNPTPPSRNQWWKQFETDLGTTMRINSVDSTQYTAKFQTAVAGGTLADITQIERVPQLPTLLEKMFTDLTPYLTGDNIKKYPNLASTPSPAWDMSMINGRIWGVTNPRIVAGTVLMTRGDLLQEKGIATMPELSDGEDFLDMCRELTDRAAGVFAIGQIPENWTVPLVVEALGGPNGWRVENDTWTSAFESPEFAQALEIVRKMYDEGLFHPNTYTDLSSTGVWWRGGATILFAQNFSSWPRYAAAPEFPTGVVVMPKWDGGGKAAKHLGAPGYGAPVGLRKTDDEKRIDELLRVADYLASPFGTEEYLKIKYGVRDRQYRLVDEQVAVIEDAPEEDFVPRYYGALDAVDLYAPGKPEVTRQIFDYCKEMIPTGVSNPSLGKFSETSTTKGAKAARALGDLLSNIIQGREPMSAWAPGVADWKKEAGDAIAREYAEQ